MFFVRSGRNHLTQEGRWWHRETTAKGEGCVGQRSQVVVAWTWRVGQIYFSETDEGEFKSAAAAFFAGDSVINKCLFAVQTNQDLVITCDSSFLFTP
jgi:hypothetical protein